MGKLYNKTSIIDPVTGEIISEKSWVGYDGFNSEGYAYRSRSTQIRYYWDCLPANFSPEAFLLLIMVSELSNENNLLIYRVHRKSKFSTIIYKPLEKDEIREKTRYRYGINKFEKYWKELTKCALKRIRYKDMMVWAVNPAIFSKCKYVPFWLYEAFQNEMNPYLSPIAIKKLQERLKEFDRDD